MKRKYRRSCTVFQLLTRLSRSLLDRNKAAIVGHHNTTFYAIGSGKGKTYVCSVCCCCTIEWIEVRVLLDVERTIHHQENIGLHDICSAHACQVVIRLICS